MFRGAFSRMFTAAGCHGRPQLRIAFETIAGLCPRAQFLLLVCFPPLRSPYNENSDHFSSSKTNATTPLLSFLEFVSEAPFKNKVVSPVTVRPCANSCSFSVGCLLNQLAGGEGHVLSLPQVLSAWLSRGVRQLLVPS